MFKMQKDNHNFRDVATDKKYILRNTGFLRKPKSIILCKMAFYIFFAVKCETFEVKRSIRPFQNKQKWLTEIVRFNFLRN